jgi:hypothetical protein
MGKLFRWSDNEQRWEDKLPTMIRKELDHLHKQISNANITVNKTIVTGQSSAGTSGSFSNTYNIHVRTSMEFTSHTSYILLSEELANVREPIRTPISFNKVNGVNVYMSLSDNDNVQRIAEPLTGISISMTSNNILEYAVKFDANYKLSLRMAEVNSTMTLVQYSYWTGQTALQTTPINLQTVYDANHLIAIVEFVINVNL